MGTVVSMRVYGEGEEVSNSLWELISNLENTVLSKRVAGSEVYELNQGLSLGESEELMVSKQLMDYLQHGKQIWEDSEGAFDLTLGALSALWNIDEQTGSEQPVLPTEQEITGAKNKSGFYNCDLDNQCIQTKGSFQLDLGAVGKGLALDEIKKSLDENKVSAAVISMGGSILTYGEKPDKSSFKVAIVNPFQTEERIGYLEITGTKCISTSGSYERYIEINNMRYHHILDPATGYPAQSGVVSVTIVSDNGFESDALSTACFILGTEKGMTLAAKYHALALFITDSGDIIMSPELESMFVKE